MAKLPIFGDFFAKVAELWKWIVDTANSVYSQIELIVTIRSVITDDFAKLIDEFKTATAEQADFADRIKSLKTKCIRADVIYQFIDEIRTGELKTFLVDTLGSLKFEWDNALTDAIKTGQDLKILKTGTLGTTNPIIKFFQAVLKIITTIATVVHALHGILPVVQALKDKLNQFESVIMQQSNPRIRLKKTISARAGFLHP